MRTQAAKKCLMPALHAAYLLWMQQSLTNASLGLDRWYLQILTALEDNQHFSALGLIVLLPSHPLKPSLHDLHWFPGLQICQ